MIKFKSKIPGKEGQKTSYQTVPSKTMQDWLHIESLTRSGWFISSVGFETVSLIKY